jgi:hypothetical protein
MLILALIFECGEGFTSKELRQSAQVTSWVRQETRVTALPRIGTFPLDSTLLGYDASSVDNRTPTFPHNVLHLYFRIERSSKN